MVDYLKNLKDKILTFKGLLFIGSADIITSAISAGFWLLVASLLSVEEYGEISYIIAIAALASSVSVIGSSNALLVYSSKQPKIIPTLLFLSLICAVVSSLIAFMIIQKYEIIFLVFAFLIFELSISILIGKKIYAKYSVFLLTQKIIQFVLSISLYFTLGFDGILIGIILSYIPLLLILYKELQNFKLNFSILKLNKEFIINTHVVHLTSVFRRDIDKIIIAPLFGFVLLGNFAFALQVYAILMIFSSISFKYLVPKEISGDKNKKLKKLLILLSIVIALLGFLFSPYLIENFFTKFSESIIPIQIISFSVIPGAIGRILFSKILALEKSRFLLLATAVQLGFIMFGTIFLGMFYGIVGIGFSFLIASIAYASTLAILNYHYIGRGKFDI